MPKQSRTPKAKPVKRYTVRYKEDGTIDNRSVNLQNLSLVIGLDIEAHKARTKYQTRFLTSHNPNCTGASAVTIRKITITTDSNGRE